MIQENSWDNRGGIQISGRGWRKPLGESVFDRGLKGLSSAKSRVSSQTTVRLILVISLVAFEIFNFDTSRFALTNLLGEASFMGLKWATILAIAFCSIDFAGLAYVFSPDRDRAQSQEVWYLMGAWLLGATMNALMTWWAVSLTLLDHDLGNEVVDRQRLLQIVPFFVAALVWLTRILFIGAFSVAGGRLMLQFGGKARNSSAGSDERVQGSGGNRNEGQATVNPSQDSASVAAGRELFAADNRRRQPSPRSRMMHRTRATSWAASGRRT